MEEETTTTWGWTGNWASRNENGKEGTIGGKGEGANLSGSVRESPYEFLNKEKEEEGEEEEEEGEKKKGQNKNRIGKHLHSKTSNRIKKVFQNSFQIALIVKFTSRKSRFLIVDDEDENKIFETEVAKHFSCTCLDPWDLCVHVLFLLLKVFKLSIYSEALIKRRISTLDLKVMMSKFQKKRIEALVSHFQNEKEIEYEKVRKKKEKPTTRRRKENGSEKCAICYEYFLDSGEDKKRITWCKSVCGNNFHAKCFETYKMHQKKSRSTLRCPLCRSLWVS